MFSGYRTYKKTTFATESTILKQTLTVNAAHSGNISADGISDNTVTLTKALLGVSDAELFANATAITNDDFSFADDKFENFYIETPVIGSTEEGGKVYLLTGLIAMSSKVISMVRGGDDVTKMLIGSGNVAEIIGAIPTGYKVIELDPATNETKIVYHSFPDKTAIDYINISASGFSIQMEVRDSDVWENPWQLGRGGIDIQVDGSNYNLFVTAPFLFRVDQITFDPSTHIFDMSTPNLTSSTIAGKSYTEGDKIEKVYPNNELATVNVLWNPWDLTISDNGDIFVAEALGGGVKRITDNGDSTWNISTIFGGASTSNNCMAGEIERKVNDASTLDEAINQSASMLCKGDVWALESKDTCGEASDRKMQIYLSQNFMTASNVIELVRPCD
jgi:hypothetical protein